MTLCLAIVQSSLIVRILLVLILLHFVRPITVEAYSLATTYFSMLYFYFWYFTMVIVVLNIITAFLLDDFTVMRAQISDEDKGVIPEWCVVVVRLAFSLPSFLPSFLPPSIPPSPSPFLFTRVIW